MFKFVTLGASALALAAMPVAASAAPVAAAAPVTAHVDRAATVVGGQSSLGGAGNGQILPLVILAGVIGAVAYLVIDHEDNNDRPSSR